jgi:hypothetical protein
MGHNEIWTFIVNYESKMFYSKGPQSPTTIVATTISTNHNDTQHNDRLFNDIQHNDTEQKSKKS